MCCVFIYIHVQNIFFDICFQGDSESSGIYESEEDPDADLSVLPDR